MVRSAYGIFYDLPIVNVNVLPRINPPFYDLGRISESECPAGFWTPQDILFQTGQSRGGAGRDDFPQFRDGYMQQWNADLQYEVCPTGWWT